MKKAFVFTILAVLATFVSCNKSEIGSQAPAEGYRYEFSVNEESALAEDMTKATLDNSGVTWVAGDRVGMFLDGYTGYAEINLENTPRTVILYSPEIIPANSYAYAYYPNASNSDKTAVKIALSNVQQGGVDAAMPMVGVPFKVLEEAEAKSRPNGTINFLNLGSIICFKVYSSKADYLSETIQYISLEASDASIAGTASIDLTKVNATDASTLAFDITENGSNTVKVNQEATVASAKTDASSIYLVLAPGQFEGTITVGTDAATYTWALPQMTFNRNGLKTFNMDLKNAERSGVVEVVKTLPYEEAFTVNQGDFSIENVTLPEGQTSIWSFDSSYGAKVTAYIDDSSNASETWLISPWIDLTDISAAAVSFDHVHRFGGDNATNNLTFWAKSEDDTAEWQQLTIPTYAPGTNWTFVNSGDIDLSAYAGKKVKVAFKYVSTSSEAATWEIKNFSAHILKADPGISYAITEFEVNVNDEFNAPVLVNPNELTVSYSSSDTEIATVDENTGLVEIGEKEGTVTITASFAGNDLYNAATASYTIKVNDPSVVTVWVKTAATDLATGDYVVIVDENSFKAMSNDKGTSSAPNAISVTISNSKLSSAPDANIQWIIGKVSEGLKFQVPETTNYLYCTDGNNGVRVGTNSNNVFSIDQNFLKHNATERYLGVYNNADWRCYTSINNNIKNTVLAFYKKTTQAVSGDVTLSSIAITTNPKTAFTVGEDFVFDGVVTATYSDDNTADVTASVSFSGYNMSTAGEQTVTVSYTEGEVTKTTTYVITVSESTTGSVTVSMSSFSTISGFVNGDTNISYEAAKGKAATAPAVNSNQIRIYQNGGLLTITANNNKKITAITIGSAMATTVTTSVDGGDASENNSIEADGTYTISGISATSVVFTCTGTDRNSRLYLNTLSVTYE